MSGNRGKALVAVVGVALSALFLWLAVRNADLDAVRDGLADARFGYVLLAVLALGVGYGFQAARWQRIADAPRLRLGSFYGMLLGGLACNNVLPVRIGELLRAGWLSRDAPSWTGSATSSRSACSSRSGWRPWRARSGSSGSLSVRCSPSPSSPLLSSSHASTPRGEVLESVVARTVVS